MVSVLVGGSPWRVSSISAFQSMIPVSTGLARGIERLLPELAGRVQAKAIRVPTVNVSCLDITLQTRRDTSAAEVNGILRDAATAGPLKNLLAYTELPHASCDFNHDPHSAIVDGSQTRVSGPRLVNLLCERALQEAAAQRMSTIEPRTIDAAAAALELLCARPRRFRWFTRRLPCAATPN